MKASKKIALSVTLASAAALATILLTGERKVKALEFISKKVIASKRYSKPVMIITEDNSEVNYI